MPDDPKRPRRRLLRRAVRWFGILCLFVLVPLALYLLAAVVGLIPVNLDFEQNNEGIELFVSAGDIHSGLILPANAAGVDWTADFPEGDFAAPRPRGNYIAFGWGDRGFYLKTPTWDSLEAGTAIHAMFWPSETVMHVSYVGKPREEASRRRVVLADEQYLAICGFIRSSFRQDVEGRFDCIDGESYGSRDAFYEGTGSYHLFYTCNNWTGSALKSAGVTVGCWTPFPRGVMIHLAGPENQ